MDGYRFYMINLERAPERRKAMEQKYDRRLLTRVSACDGRSVDVWALPDVVLPPKEEVRASPLEIATTISHVRAIHTAFAQGMQEAIIVEDDIYPLFSRVWGRGLRATLAQRPSDAECVTLFGVNPRVTREHLAMASTVRFAPRHPEFWSCACYFLTRAGMARIVREYVQADGRYCLRGDLVADRNMLYPKMRTYHHTRPLFVDEGRTSYIHPSHLTGVHLVNRRLLLAFVFKDAAAHAAARARQKRRPQARRMGARVTRGAI